MQFSTRFFLFGSLILSQAVGNNAHACDVQTAFPMAPAALRQWEKAKSTVLADHMRREFLFEYCVAGVAVSKEKGIPISTINSAADRIVALYMGEYLDPGVPVRSVTAVLRSVLGVSGFSKPRIRKWAVLEVNYAHQVIELLIDTRSYEPAKKYLLEPGQVQVRGKDQSGRTVCKGSISLRVVQPSVFSC